MDKVFLRRLLDDITEKLGGLLDRSFECPIEEIKQALITSGQYREQTAWEEGSEARIRRLVPLGIEQYKDLTVSMLPHYLPKDFDLFQRLFGGAYWLVRDTGSLTLNGFGFSIAVFHEGLQDPHETGVVDLRTFPFLPIGSVGFPSKRANDWVYRDIVLALGGSPLAGTVYSVAKSRSTIDVAIEAAKGLPPQAVVLASSFYAFLNAVLETHGDLGLDAE